ncbi:hypothetical protein diail_8598 [Diaporthe ilicicola]|nr:hypothetical protein diail_8598 [Diaporthe ilicicola]
MHVEPVRAKYRMDGPIIAATTAALAAASQTAYVVTDFLKDVPPAHSELESVLIELFDLRGFFERLQHLAPPDALCHPLIGVTRGCTDVCARIDSALAGCGDGPLRSGRWAITDASVDIRRLGRALGFCRQTLQFAFEAISRNVSHQTMADVEYVRKHLTPSGLRVARLDALLAHCLDEVEHYVEAVDSSPAASPESPGVVEQIPPTTPSVATMMSSFRRMSSDSMDRGELRPYSSTSSELQSISEASAHSHSGAAPDDGQAVDGPGQDSRRLKPSPLQLTVKSMPMGDARPTPGYSLFPSPPPTKSLPPIPPPKSPYRRKGTGMSPSSIRAPSIPAKSRSRAASEVTHDLNRDSKFSSLSEAASNRHSVASSVTKPPVRSSSYAYEPPLASPKPTVSTVSEDSGLEIVPVRRLEPTDKDSSHGVYSIDTSPTSTVLASRHGKTHVNLWDLTSGCELITTIKVSSNVQAQPRSRENFIRSHAILSETLNLVVITSGFGHTLEIHNWARRKKVQTIGDAYRWAYARQASQSEHYPLAAYREDRDTIDLFPSSPPSSKKPFGKPRSIELRKAGLPHLPRLPELAYSATGPLLVAAAGPRPPRPNCPPPEHAALLMAWRLDDAGQGHRPYKFLMPDRRQHPELENSLALSLVTYGSVAVSVWIQSKFKTIGRPGMWQVEPAVVTERVVLVWDFSTDKTTTYRIPDALNCVSPDCRFVAYCDPGSPQRHGGLAVLDAMSGRELWRLGGSSSNSSSSNKANAAGWDGRSVSSRRSGRSSQRSGRSSEGGDSGGGAGLEKLGGDLGRVTELAFSGDSSRLFVGDVDGGVGVYDIREGLGIGREKSLQQDTHYF